jgi:hypothetical protein
MTRSGSPLPSWRPTTIAIAVAATMPSVAPSQVPAQPFCEASVIVASMVLSPSSASRKADPTVKITEWPARAGTSPSSSLSSRVQIANPMNTSPAATEIQRVGSARPSP